MVERMDIIETVKANVLEIPDVLEVDIVNAMMDTLAEEYKIELKGRDAHISHLENIIDQMGMAFIELGCIDGILGENDELHIPEIERCTGMSQFGIVCINRAACDRFDGGEFEMTEDVISPENCMSSLTGDGAYDSFICGN